MTIKVIQEVCGWIKQAKPLKTIIQIFLARHWVNMFFKRHLEPILKFNPLTGPQECLPSKACFTDVRIHSHT